MVNAISGMISSTKEEGQELIGALNGIRDAVNRSTDMQTSTSQK